MKCDELKDYDIMDIEAIDDERIKASSNGEVVPSTRVYIKADVDKRIDELKDKIQMHDFFWEGCGFDKLGFKNAIAVRNYCDKLKAENERASRWYRCTETRPTPDDGYILVLWEDGVPDIGYIGAEADVIETVRDRGEGHSVEFWRPLPKAPGPQMTYDDLIVCTYEDQLFNVAFDYYEVEPVNKLIEELKERLHEAETRADLAEAANTKYRIDIQNLKKRIEELE